MINKQRLINTFLELVQINSESGKEQAIQQFLKAKFETLNVIVEEDKDISNDYCCDFSNKASDNITL